MHKSPLMLSIAIVTLCIPLLRSPGARANQGSAITPTPQQVVAPSTGGCQDPPALSPLIPADISAGNSQANVNCMAWQEFLALNWPASISSCDADASSSPSTLGQPDDPSPVVWETFKEAHEVFQRGATAPSPWCSKEPLRYISTNTDVRQLEPTSPHGYKTFSLVAAKTGDHGFSSFEQAGTKGWWLTDQNRNRTLYEVRLNSDEFSYISWNHLYDASIQHAFVKEEGIDLPDGTPNFRQYGRVGSIEIKAAWVELPDPSRWKYFKTSKAYVINPVSGAKPRLVTVGLVGLHIIHKTAKAPQFIWATFEHVNNAPSMDDLRSRNLLPWYVFFDRNCNPKTDHYACAANAAPASGGSHQSGDAYAAPMQVIRENPISSRGTDNVAGLNQWVWNLIRSGNPDSVWLNYQLVDAQWASSPATVAAGAQIPLTAGNPQPNPVAQKVTNTTMETYSQNSKSCLDCHTQAAIARGKYASDYSFLFGMADKRHE